MLNDQESSDNEVETPGTFTAKSGGLTIRRPIATFIKRSTFFANALSAFPLTRLPLGASEAIEVPYVDEETFKYYLRCVEDTQYAKLVKFSGEARRGPPSAEVVNAKINFTILQYCKGYDFAMTMGDCAAANLIIDALIDYSAETNTVLGDKHVNWIIGNMSNESGLYKLAVDMWAFATRSTKVSERAGFGNLQKVFLQDVLLEIYAATGQEAERTVGEVFGEGLIQRQKERYHCYNELHPQR